MITYLPFSNFKQCAQVLDDVRLEQQRLDCKQLLKEIFNPKSKCKDPFYQLWKDFPFALIAYGLEICIEWAHRGHKDKVYSDIEAYGLYDETIYPVQTWMQAVKPECLPPWLGDNKLHDSHKSQLIQVCPEHYKNWDVSKVEFFWPKG